MKLRVEIKRESGKSQATVTGSDNKNYPVGTKIGLPEILFLKVMGHNIIQKDLR